MLLLTSAEVPPIFRSSFIETGYRPVNHHSLWQCFRSLFQLHNETVNIWTHLLSALVFWHLFLFYFRKGNVTSPTHSKCRDSSTAQHNSNHIIAALCGTKASVFFASFVAHSCCSYSENAYIILFRIDWSMICVAMFGSCITINHFAFFHYPRQRKFWWKAFACSCTAMLVVVNYPGFTRLQPGVKFLGGLIPVPCILGFFVSVARTLPRPESMKFLQDLLGPIALAILGVFIYGSQLPERWYPGQFDLTGGSHTFHHFWTTTYAAWMVHLARQWFKWRHHALIPK